MDDQEGDQESEPGSLFREAMTDVAPLHGGDNRENSNPKGELRDPTLAQLQRREGAVDEGHDRVDPNYLHQGEVALIGPRDELSWKKDGVQDGVFRKLRQGGYPIDAELDLHRLTVSEARDAVFRFLKSRRASGHRTLLIAHGRGERSDPPARIKSYVAHWLQQDPNVIAFHSAVPRRGGTGAVCLLLKKSAQTSEDNRERFS